MSKRNPFDFVKSASYDKKDIMVDDIEEKPYQPFLVNKSLSYHEDCIFLTNEMNTRHSTESRLQYVFFLNTLRRRQVFQMSVPLYLKETRCNQTVLSVSTRDAKEYASLLSDKQYRELKNRMQLGSRNNE